VNFSGLRSGVAETYLAIVIRDNYYETATYKGNLESGGGLYTGDFEWRMREGSRNGASLFEGNPWGGPAGRVPLLWTPKYILSKVLEWTSVSIGAPLLGNMEGRPFLRVFEIKRFIQGHVKISCKRISLSLSIGGFVGEPAWDTLSGTFWEKRKSISGFLSWTQRTLF
jgi:hypothetical protein